jgi:hypothetical protein
MSDKALENAEMQRAQLLEQRAALREQLVLVEGKLASAERFIYDWHQYAGTAESAFANTPATPRRMVAEYEPGTWIPKKRRNTKKEIVAAEARQIIEERKVVMSRTDLFNELVARGCIIEGSEPEMVLSTMLWRTKDTHHVIHLRNVGYWLAELSWLPAMYSPEIESMMGVEDERPPEDADAATWHHVASIVLADMETARLQSVNAEVKRSGSIPDDLEAALVEEGRRALLRDLDQVEQQALLDIFCDDLAELVA